MFSLCTLLGLMCTLWVSYLLWLGLFDCLVLCNLLSVCVWEMWGLWFINSVVYSVLLCLVFVWFVFDYLNCVVFVGFGNCGVWFVYVSYGFDCLLYFGVGYLNLDWLYVVCLLVGYCVCGFIVWCLFVVWLIVVGWFTWLFVCLMIFGCVLVCTCWV